MYYLHLYRTRRRSQDRPNTAACFCTSAALPYMYYLLLSAALFLWNLIVCIVCTFVHHLSSALRCAPSLNIATAGIIITHPLPLLIPKKESLTNLAKILQILVWPQHQYFHSNWQFINIYSIIQDVIAISVIPCKVCQYRIDTHW